MIRLIDLGKQTSDGDGPRQFAFWNTVKDMFLDYNDTQAWATYEQLQQDIFWHIGREAGYDTLRRLEPLVPAWARLEEK
jgi:hypothetical protein